jgi:hypothetical protein
MTDIKLRIAGATGWTGSAIGDAALTAPDIGSGKGSLERTAEPPGAGRPRRGSQRRL